MSAILQVTGISKRYPARDGNGVVHAVSDVNLMLASGETLGIVGESGCGKSTLARLILRLVEPSSGSIVFDGKEISALSPSAMRSLRRDIQIVFQDPYASLDPRMRISQIISEPLDIHKIGSRMERKLRVNELLQLVGLDPDVASRYPHEFSGGQRQRIGIARAIALNPKLVVLDEPVSALDVSIQSQVLNLLADLKGQLNLSYIFISHDLSVIHHVSDRIAVMYLGRIVEEGSAIEVLQRPLHPYTQALVSSVPDIDPDRRKKRQPLVGELPNPEAIPSGCAFHPRCPKVMDICRTVGPPTRNAGTQIVTCHLN